MLEAIRKRAGSLIVKILFLILVLSFGVWGIADVFRPGRGPDWAAEVGAVKISTAAFQEEYRDAMRRLGQALGGPVEAEQARALGLPGSVLNRMIQGALFDLAAADLGVTLTDAVVREQIKSNPQFHNQAGAFDPEVFRELLRRNGFSEDRYVGLLRRELQRQQLVGSITGGIVPPQRLVEATDRYRSERRIAEYAMIADAEMSGFPDPDEPTLRQFWQDNPGLFTVPELRTVSAVVLSADEAAKDASVGEDDLRAAYEERSGEFTLPERRSFRQMVFADEATAQRARERLAQGGEFDAVAAEFRNPAGHHRDRPRSARAAAAAAGGGGLRTATRGAERTDKDVARLAHRRGDGGRTRPGADVRRGQGSSRGGPEAGEGGRVADRSGQQARGCPRSRRDAAGGGR